MMQPVTIALMAAAITIAAPAAAQDPVGYWQGTLQIGSVSLDVGVDIQRHEGGELSGTMDSPDQNAFDIPLAAIEAADGALSFTVPAIGGRYEGTWDAAQDHWNGTWTQGGNGLPLILSDGERPDRAAAAPRPSLPEEWAIPADEAIATTIDERIAQRPGTGMVLAIVTSGRGRLVARGPEGDTAFDADTVFEIGSMTKVFTGLLLADMALDGTVSLDDPVAKYLPEGASMPVRKGEQITLRNLAQQDSGLPRLPSNLTPDDMRDPYADYTEQQLLDFLSSYELTRDIGSQYEYSNLGVGLLGYALSRAAGTEYETLLRTRILDPLGMGDTGIALSADQQARFATGRDEYNRPTSAWRLPALAGAGALRSTAADLSTFLRAALDPQSPIGPAMELALTNPREAPGYRAGLGWMIVPAPSGMVAMHGGGTGGFRSHMALQASTGRAVVVLTNSAIEPSAQDIALHTLIGAPLTEARLVPTAPNEVAREEVALSEAQLDRVTGTYRFAPGMDLEITRQGDQLLATITGQGALPIAPRAPLEFFWRAVNADIVFIEEEGRITGATFTQDGRSSPLTKVE